MHLNPHLPRPQNALILMTMLLVLGCSASVDVGSSRIAPLLPGMGEHHFEISTSSEEAQQFFDQGLVLAYGFNHGEAARSFRQAIELDPECSMCHWGLSLTLGPNINSTMDPADLPEAYEALTSAVGLASTATPREKAYIEALSERYVSEWNDDRGALDVAYAEAMRSVYEAFPHDPDAGALYAEALMDTTPWDYWLEDGEPKPVTAEFLAVLEDVLATDADHPGAHHFYIHAVEAVHPQKGIVSAEKLAQLVPGAGHLVHMPSHIYIRVGRYQDAVAANEAAIAADDEYVTACHAQGLYPLAYMPHNRHFLWASASFAGQGAVAVKAAQEMAAKIDQDKMREPGLETLQHFWVTPLYAYTRFGRWDETLAAPEPAEDLIYPRGVWHYARAMAMIRTEQLDAAQEELDALAAFAADPALESITLWDINTTAALLAIATEVVSGELAAGRRQWDRAIAHLERGAELEDDLNYDEPPPWHAPVRHNLGAVLLQAGRVTEAEAVYRTDLETFPANGWSLYGLRQSLTEQHRDSEAAQVAQELETAFEHADVVLTRSRV
jgi:tetratricopeptide (TPR) repeat protein